jgi:pimeloyl-ACP methyl ester carboxylesterase
MTLVFIHGAGCTGDVFARQRDAFPGGIALTLPGHTTPGEPASIAEFADAVFAAVDASALDAVVLCGSSMGGAVAIECALRRDPRVRGVVLLGSGAKLRVAPAIIEGIERDFEATARSAAGYFFAEPTPERIDGVLAMMRAVGPAQTARDYRACDAFDRVERLSEIDVPVLAVTGENDVMTPPKFAHFIADRVPGAAARIVPGAGHLVMLERPADTNEAIRAFVSQL